MFGRPLVVTVSNEDRKDTDMKLLLVFAAVLALSLADEAKKTEKSEIIDDQEAEASVNIELLKEGADLKTAASSYTSYVPPSQRPPHWTQPENQNTWYQPPKDQNIQPIHTTATGSPPSNVQSDYYYPSYPSYPTYNPHPVTTTTPVSVIKNEQYYGDNGYYKYEYQIADGTHVGEEGYFTDPKREEESLVKKGWYSYVGADGKTYTVTYWADKTGFHAYGDHLPTPPPVPAAIQASLDNKPQHDEYPSQTPAPVQYPTKPAPVHYPTPAPVHYPTPAPVHYPTPAPVQYPTQAPIQYPTQPPAVYPVQPPVQYPTQAPAVQYPTTGHHHHHDHKQQPQQVYYPQQQQQPQQVYYPQQQQQPQQTYYPQQNY